MQAVWYSIVVLAGYLHDLVDHFKKKFSLFLQDPYEPFLICLCIKYLAQSGVVPMLLRYTFSKWRPAAVICTASLTTYMLKRSTHRTDMAVLSLGSLCSRSSLIQTWGEPGILFELSEVWMSRSTAQCNIPEKAEEASYVHCCRLSVLILRMYLFTFC